MNLKYILLAKNAFYLLKSLAKITLTSETLLGLLLKCWIFTVTIAVFYCTRVSVVSINMEISIKASYKK